jgi:hypothetical protein
MEATPFPTPTEEMTDKDAIPLVCPRMFKPTCLYIDRQDEKDKQAPSQGVFSLGIPFIPFIYVEIRVNVPALPFLTMRTALQ